MNYLGGKYRLAGKILPYLTKHDANIFVEPFVGGANILTRAARHFDKVYAMDAHQDLIELYKFIQDGNLGELPQLVSEEEYKAYRELPSSPARTFVGFGASFGGKYWAGYGRNKGRRNYAGETWRSLERSLKAGAFDPHVTFKSCYFDTLRPEDYIPEPGKTVLYADPPYKGTTAYKGLEPMDHDATWERFREWAAAGAHVYVSEFNGPEEHEVASFPRKIDVKLAKGEPRKTVIDRLYYFPAQV